MSHGFGSTFPFESLRDREEKRWKEAFLFERSAGEPTLQVALAKAEGTVKKKVGKKHFYSKGRLVSRPRVIFKR